MYVWVKMSKLKEMENRSNLQTTPTQGIEIILKTLIGLVLTEITETKSQPSEYRQTNGVMNIINWYRNEPPNFYQRFLKNKQCLRLLYF